MIEPGDWVKVPPKSGRRDARPFWSARVLEVREDGYVKVTLRGTPQAYWERSDRVEKIEGGTNAAHP